MDSGSNREKGRESHVATNNPEGGPWNEQMSHKHCKNSACKWGEKEKKKNTKPIVKREKWTKKKKKKKINNLYKISENKTNKQRNHIFYLCCIPEAYQKRT